MSIGSEKELAALRRVGKIVGLTVREMAKAVRPGMTTLELDQLGEEVMTRHGARSAPRKVYNFPGANCISVNDEVVHGVPGPRVLRNGDLVKIDVTAELDGFLADSATTVQLGQVGPVKRKLCIASQTALQKAIAVARAGRPLNEIGRVVEAEVHKHGFVVIPTFCGHGIGRTIHEEPEVTNFYNAKDRTILTEGLVITIEPIISAGSDWAIQGEDGWTERTADGSPSAHFEHTIVITRDKPIILTAA